MAQTFSYFVAGYVVILTGLTGYILSLALRWKKLKEEKKHLQGE